MTGLARRRWGLTDLTPIAETATSRVFKARYKSGHAVLKVLKPYGLDEMRGAHLMAWLDGAGAARIFDTHENMILMEYLEGPPLGFMARAGHDEDATDILCSVAALLHDHRAGPLPELEGLDIWFETLFASRVEDWPTTHRGHFQRAKTLARELLETTTRRIPLHGDFHHDNVINSSRGWLALDPKGLVGDPAYEFANVFRNPFGGNEIARRPERIDRLARQISERTGLDELRILKWAAAHSAISACWDRVAGNSDDWDLVMLPLLLDAVDDRG